MSARLSADPRYRLAPARARQLYATLFVQRDELAYALAVHPPEAVAGLYLGCAPAEAAEHLVALRALGLLGEGLQLVAGVGRPRGPTNTNANPVTMTGVADDLPARARASGRSVSELARAAGLERSALSKYLATGAGLGTDRRARLADALGCAAGVQSIPCETRGVQSPVQLHTTDAQAQGTPPAPSVPPVPPSSPLALPSDSLPDPLHSPALPAREAGGANQEPANQTPEANPTKPVEPAPKVAPLVPKEPPAEKPQAPAAKRKRAPKAPALAPVDPTPPPGSLAAKVLAAIVGDPTLAPITLGPGDFAIRACAEGAYPGVDVLAEVRRAGEFASGKPAGSYSNGRGYLRGWLRRAAETIARTPKVAPVGARVTGTVADLTARAMAAKAERERLAQAAKEPQTAAGGTR